LVIRPSVGLDEPAAPTAPSAGPSVPADGQTASGTATLPVEPDQQYSHLHPLLVHYAGLSEHDPARIRLREQLLTGYLPVAHHLAQRYARRGVPIDDLVQVATIGLINAVDRYDPAVGGGFLAYAVPTMRGELRRYFRDHTWSMRVPRRIKDLHVAVSRASTALSVELGRAPRPSEIAGRLDVPLDDVLEALQASEAYTSRSLDTAMAYEVDGQTKLGDLLGQADARLELVEYRHALRPMLAELPERERTILVLRFFGDMTQTQIAEQIGVSQMHVSRLLSQTLARLREQLSDR
jgi:RNA polymerase sigma-B factor